MLISRPVHVTHFSPHDSHVLSASDDTTVKVWDLTTQECLHTLSSHTDYVRSALFHPTSPHLIFSSSYDATFRIHDTRMDSPNVMTMSHGDSPIEDMLAFPSGTLCVTVGGPIMRVWDMNVGRCVKAMSNHQKTITSVTLDGSRSKLLTGGLDQMVKVYDVEDWRVVHTMRYSAPVLSLAVSVSHPLQRTSDRSPTIPISLPVSPMGPYPSGVGIRKRASSSSQSPVRQR